ncbi:conserved hypothetical protein [Rhodococcus sp. RD6.2]|uniref:helix-turn-helix domain-containing protein n=1 Tax=Rhodococcus sp. RD6.2 TaxID=260936 RepID=UPI00063BC866|nr:helix-turn-helix transcriptional regulator [Rhodococcus sp. RD6.2]CRK54417.1 conserved hypothetical protein [Rhodococcus sp. RD6.2]
MRIPIRDLPVVIGANAKRLRKDADLTLDAMAIAARRRGLKWNTSRVADFEAGRVSPNLATLTAYAFALADAGCGDITLSDLVESSTDIRVNDAMTLHRTDLHDVMTGDPIASKLGPRAFIGPLRLKTGNQILIDLADDAAEEEAERVARYLERTDAETVISVVSASGSTEERIHRALRISPALLAAVSAALWGRSFSDERDARAGANANAQKRGQITRRLQAELKGELDNGDD